ncbi:MAG: sensor histidine kinase [Hormoscilla sp.]
MFQKIDSQLSPPSFSEGSDRAFSLESTLGDLPLHDFQVEISCLGVDLARMFEKYRKLPGAILLERSEFTGMISRRILLELLLRPQGIKLFLSQSVEVLYSYARTEILVLPSTMPILEAVGQAFRRSPELLGEPVVVKGDSQTYHILDINELNQAAWLLRGIEAQVRYERAQVQMIQTEKMASLGRLVDGVAHEVLDPVNFIWGNLNFVSIYNQYVMELLLAYENNLSPIEISELKAEIEFEFLQADLPRAIKSIQKGSERLKILMTSLQNFCHIDEVYPKAADLHACLDGILLLLKSRINSEIEIVRNYGHLPPVMCFAGQLNQAFMNILTNAVDALLNQAVTLEFTRSLGGEISQMSYPRIEITTQVFSLKKNKPNTRDNRWISINIADNGPGLSAKKLKEIRESFSVEKREEKETSLAVSYQIVTAKHGGEFQVRSQQGSGTEFEILLPLVQ